jgi:hypothetical protein
MGTSLPVKTPVICSIILLKNELPERGNDAKATLLPIMDTVESKNLYSPETIASYFEMLSSLTGLMRTFFRVSKLILRVSEVGLTVKF